MYQSSVSIQILCLYYYIVHANSFSILYHMSSQYYLVNDLSYYINPEVTDNYVCLFVCLRLTPQKMSPTQYARTVRL
jgi:hypothetical protein